MKKMTCLLLVAFLAGIAASTPVANAARASGTRTQMTGAKSSFHHPKHKHPHRGHFKKKHNQKARV